MLKNDIRLGLKKVPAVKGLIGFQATLDGEPYDSEPELIEYKGTPVAIINGKMIDGVMQVQLPEIGDVG